MKKYFILFVSFLLLVVQWSCSETDLTDNPIPGDITLNDPLNEFVWQGLNSEYYWQQNVSNLDDSKDNVQDDFYTYLNGFSSPQDLFESLLYQKGVEDRFSWFVEDYDAQNASFRGISDSFGFDFGLSRLCDGCNEVIGYITYVVPNSPAADAELKRGDVFYVFNDTELKLDNYTVVNAFYRDSQISMEFATITDGEIIPNNKAVSLNLREVIENPVFYNDVITNDDGTKVGYLVYNGFKYTFHEELNQIFEIFKNENIQELILDLRYNGGGSVLTSAYLASMIYSGASTTDVFGKLVHNDKNSSEDGAYPFFNTALVYDKDGNNSGNNISISRLNTLSRVIVITSDDTASASEMIINGLLPYLQVIKVGTTTYGKNVGSRTVYDSPDFSSNNINPNHFYAMQPITFKIFNASNESDYTQGFDPDYEVIEYVSEMKPFGDLEEPLLSAALNVISGNVAKIDQLKYPEIKSKRIFSSLELKPFSKEMYKIPE